MSALAHTWVDGPWWGLLGMLAWAAFWVLVVLVVVAALRGRRRSDGSGGPGGHALRVLEERYARGEIGREEFTERRKVLLGGPASGARPGGS